MNNAIMRYNNNCNHFPHYLLLLFFTFLNASSILRIGWVCPMTPSRSDNELGLMAPPIQQTTIRRPTPTTQQQHSTNSSNTATTETATETAARNERITDSSDKPLRVAEKIALSNNNVNDNASNNKTSSTNTATTTITTATLLNGTRPRWNSSYIQAMKMPFVIPDSVEIMYSHPRGDRSGAAIMDALLAHALTWTVGRKYGGVCGPIYPATDDHRRLIQVLGLEEELPYPKQVEHCERFNGTNSMVIPRNGQHIWKDTGLFTTEWMQYIQQQRKLPPPPSSPLRIPPRFQKYYAHFHHVIVHIRRGDVTPCDNIYYERYFPNSHYIALIDNYTPRMDTFYHVTIYSELTSFESWNDFQYFEKGNVVIKITLGGNITNIWRDMLGYKAEPSTQRTLILSISTFSLVPALFADPSTTTVVYTHHGHFPLRHWHVVGRELTKQSQAKTLWLRQHNCSRTFHAATTLPPATTNQTN